MVLKRRRKFEGSFGFLIRVKRMMGRLIRRARIKRIVSKVRKMG